MSITSAQDTRNESYSMQYLNWQQTMKQELQNFMEMVDRFLDPYLEPYISGFNETTFLLYAAISSLNNR